MLGNGDNAKISNSVPCQVDPEERLQEARKNHEQAVKDLDTFLTLPDLYEQQTECLAITGALYMRCVRAKSSVTHWLAEIDKE